MEKFDRTTQSNVTSTQSNFTSTSNQPNLLGKHELPLQNQSVNMQGKDVILNEAVPREIEQKLTLCQQCGQNYTIGEKHIHQKILEKEIKDVKVNELRSHEVVHENILPREEKIIHKHLQPALHQTHHMTDTNIHQGEAINIHPKAVLHVHEATQPIHEKTIHTHIAQPIHEVRVVNEGPLPQKVIETGRLDATTFDSSTTGTSHLHGEGHIHTHHHPEHHHVGGVSGLAGSSGVGSTGLSGSAGWNNQPGMANTGQSNTGMSNTGLSNTGMSNTGLSNTGMSKTGMSNTGMSNTEQWSGDRRLDDNDKDRHDRSLGEKIKDFFKGDKDDRDRK